MQPEAIMTYLATTYPGVGSDTSTPDSFFFRGAQRKFPFATIVTRNHPYDASSHLDRPGVFRLNLGLDHGTFDALFPHPTHAWNFAAFDVLLPHPVYARQHWVSIVNPLPATFSSQLAPLITCAWKHAARHERLGAPA